MRRLATPLALICLLAACDPSAPPDAGTVDADVVDGATSDAAVDGVVQLRILGITDFHGRLFPPEGETLGGVSYLASHVEALRAQQPNTLVVSSGDLIGGSTLESALLYDEPTIDAMDLLGLDASAVGNHEFDRPLAELRRLVAGGCHPSEGCVDEDAPFDGASFPLLGANVVEVASGEPAFPAYVIRDVSGVGVAIVGVALEETAELVYAPYVEGLRFEDEAETVNDLIPTLEAEGADVIVVLLHAGFQPSVFIDCANLVGTATDVVERLDPAVDVVFAGHTHFGFACPPNGGPAVLQAGSWGNVLGQIDLTVDRATGEVIDVDTVLVEVTRDVPPVAELEGFLSSLDTHVGPRRDREVGRITEDVPNGLDAAGNMAAGYLVADAMAAESADADFALMNQGGLRTTLSYAATGEETEDGIVTFGELFALVPFNNFLLTMTLTGAQVEAVLEQQLDRATPNYLQPSASLSFTWRTDGAPGDFIDPVDVTIDGVPLDLEATYRVATNNFLAEGGAGFSGFLEGTARRAGRADVELIADYLMANRPYAPPALDRIERR